MAGQMFSKNNFKNLFLLFFIICQFGAIVSDSHIWDWGVYLALNILIVLYVYLRPGEARTKSSQQKLLIAVLIHTAVIISTLWRAYRVSFIMDIFFDILDFWAIWGFILILKFGLSKRQNCCRDVRERNGRTKPVWQTHSHTNFQKVYLNGFASMEYSAVYPSKGRPLNILKIQKL